LNVFLVALNAEIKFHRYLEMIDSHPPTKPLPNRILALMRRTVELVELIYWVPVTPSKRRGSSERAAMGDHAKNVERGSSEETGTEMEDEGTRDPVTFRAALSRRKELSWPVDMDLEARMAYGRFIMYNHDREYDPALFGDAIPVDGAVDPHSERPNVEV